MSKSMRLVACVIAILVLAISGAFARTYFLPTYQAGLDGRTNDSKYNPSNGGSCADYGYVDGLSSCTSPQVLGKPINIYQGKTCYKCICPSKYRYGTGAKAEKCKYASTGERPVGDKCYSEDAGEYLYTACGCPDGWISEIECEDQGYKGVGEGCFNRNDAWTYYESCGCPTSYYPLSSYPNVDGMFCSSCSINGSTNYRCWCKTYQGYVCTSGDFKSGNCTSCERVCNTDAGFLYDDNKKTCTCYTLHGFVASGSGCVCDASRGYISSGTNPATCACDTDKGWKKIRGGACSAVACPTGYDNAVSSCSSSSNKPDLICNGWSGGKQCCSCGCKNNSECDRTKYPLTAKPKGAGLVGMCSTGCGDEKVTYYVAATCKTGYTLTNGDCIKNEEATTCEAKGWRSNIQSGQECTLETLADGTKCFNDCRATYCTPGFYTTTKDDLLRTPSGEAVGFTYNHKNYILLKAEQRNQTGGQFKTCSSLGGIVPEVGMTSSLNALAAALPSGTKKTVLTSGTPWLTSATTGTYCDSHGVPNGGGPCGTGDAHHALSNGGCFSWASGGGSCMPNGGGGTPLTVCVQDCNTKPVATCESSGYESSEPSGISLCSNYNFYSGDTTCYEKLSEIGTTCYAIRTIKIVSLELGWDDSNQGPCIANFSGSANVTLNLYDTTTGNECELTESSYCGYSNQCNGYNAFEIAGVYVDNIYSGFSGTSGYKMIQDPTGNYYALKIGG